MALKRHWFHILLALAEGTTNGAEIRRRVSRHAGEALKLYPAMLYGSLEELEDAGLIEEVDEGSGRPPAEHGRYRYYRLTQAGSEKLAGETERLEDVVRHARDLLSELR